VRHSRFTDALVTVSPEEDVVVLDRRSAEGLTARRTEPPIAESPVHRPSAPGLGRWTAVPSFSAFAASFSCFGV
jgi:hypothetical protein